MQSRIILISDDSNFFDYVSPRLTFRKSDELYRFNFSEIPERLHAVEYSLFIINAENKHENTLQLLEMLENQPVIVFEFNEDEEFKLKVYQRGVYAYMTLFTPESEFEAKVVSGLNIVSSFEKANRYREILVKNNLLTQNNEVFLDYKSILDRELAKINEESSSAVLAAISPNEKTKFLLQSNQIETIILNNVRKNDLLMNYAANKYFLLLRDANMDFAQKIWEKITKLVPEKIYAGFANVNSKSREQLVNEVLNKLHESINRDYFSVSQVEPAKVVTGNFKFYRQEFNKKLEQTITPVFYLVQQKYNEKLYGVTIEQTIGEGSGNLSIKGKYAIGTFKITSPGLSKINIDITYQKNSLTDGEKVQFPQAKRISLEPEELEEGLLEDLLQQFIAEFKQEVSNDYT